MQECVAELVLVAKGGFKSKKDDFIDSISMLGMITTWRPSEVIPAIINESGIYELDEEEETISSLSSYIV